MARPKKQTVDYFPHQCTHGKTMYILEQKYGNDGYAFWFKLLELLGCAEGHYLKLENPVDWEFLTAKTRLSGETCEEILNLLVKLEAIDAAAWEQRIVWSDNFIENIKDAYRNRTIEIPKKPDCLRKKPHKERDKQRQKSPNEMKVNETKVNEIKEVSAVLANRLKEWVIENNPKAKIPSSLNNWALEIERMIRIDGRSEGEVKEIIDYCQQHDFWWKNILSADKLRKQYDRLYNEMVSDRNKNKKQNVPQAWDNLREWAAEKEAQESGL